jgi:hypothetical protein
MSKNIKCILINITYIMCKLVSHPHCTNFLLKSKVGTQNGRLHVKLHEQFCKNITLLYAVVNNFQSSKY